MSGEQVLVVDDELSMRQFLQILLERDGYRVRTAASGAEGALARRRAVARSRADRPQHAGNERDGAPQGLKARAAGATDSRADVRVIMVTAFGTTESAIEAMKHGAVDYILKPFNNDELRLVVRRALGQSRLEAENARLRTELQDRFHFGNLVGASEAMRAVYALIHRVKDTRINCLLSGESGTGKEMVARAIHYSGNRSEHPFVAINCGAIPENLVESELFGHKRGSFTGAVKDKTGLMQKAHRGTLFLDEVNSLPLTTQVKLLRALQERRFMPVGGTQELEVDLRLLAATNADLEEQVAAGEFREDLFYRLNVVQVRLPPLRDGARTSPTWSGTSSDTSPTSTGSRSGSRPMPWTS